MKNCILLFIILFTAVVSAQENNSPYLKVNLENANIPLMKTTTDVEISGTIALVKVTQVYQNNDKVPIDATYVFPLSTQAAVHKMQMKIGERIVNAKIFKKNEAQKVYDKAVKEGKRAAKLDQERPNIFKMKVGNIMPGDKIAIEIYYTEMLIPENGNYQFVAPGVVGPRFTGESTSNNNTFNQPYTKKGIADTFQFDLNVRINAGMMIQNVSSSSHKINVNYPNAQTAEVFLSKSNSNPANRDFILNYNLRGKAINSGLLLYEAENENFFAYLVEPQNAPKTEEIPAREYIFIVDVSGSMNGYPLEVSRKLMRNLLCNLASTDTFNVQLFASSSTIFRPQSVTVTTENIEAAINFLSEGQGGGGTELLSALETAYKLPRSNTKNARSMVIITDGYVNIEKEAFKIIQDNLNQANVFTFGIGSSVNRYLIEGMAKVANSQSFIAATQEEAEKVAASFKEYIATPLLTQIKLKADGMELYDVSPASIPDVFAARPIVIFGKYKGEAKGKFILTGYQGNKKYSQEYAVSNGNLSKTNIALQYLWARNKIAELDDYNTLFNENVKDAVTKLGLQYNLATKYTSFVAVDEVKVNKDGTLKSVNQPLPMPLNVENTAVGAEAKVEGKSIVTKSFNVSINGDELTREQTRNIKMWFMATYNKECEILMKSMTAFRVTFDENGKVSKVETITNGAWTVNAKLTKDFATLNATLPVTGIQLLINISR